MNACLLVAGFWYFGIYVGGWNFYEVVYRHFKCNRHKYWFRLRVVRVRIVSAALAEYEGVGVFLALFPIECSRDGYFLVFRNGAPKRYVHAFIEGFSADIVYGAVYEEICTVAFVSFVARIRYRFRIPCSGCLRKQEQGLSVIFIIDSGIGSEVYKRIVPFYYYVVTQFDRIYCGTSGQAVPFSP